MKVNQTSSSMDKMSSISASDNPCFEHVINPSACATRYFPCMRSKSVNNLLMESLTFFSKVTVFISWYDFHLRDWSKDNFRNRGKGDALNDFMTRWFCSVVNWRWLSASHALRIALAVLVGSLATSQKLFSGMTPYVKWYKKNIYKQKIFYEKKEESWL